MMATAAGSPMGPGWAADDEVSSGACRLGGVIRGWPEASLGRFLAVGVGEEADGGGRGRGRRLFLDVGGF